MKREEVEHIAHLARIRLTEEELVLFSKQLEDILGFMEKLGELDTEDVEPMPYAVDVKNAFQEGEPRPIPREEALRNAPATDFEERFFSVPRILGAGSKGTSPPDKT